MGNLASMITDACFSFSVMGYQPWGIAHGRCETYQSTLARIEGRLSDGRDGKADGLCLKAKVSYRPCCARATHVALPPSYSLGPLGDLKQKGIRVGTEFGPWAPRRLALY